MATLSLKQKDYWGLNQLAEAVSLGAACLLESGIYVWLMHVWLGSPSDFEDFTSARAGYISVVISISAIAAICNGYFVLGDASLKAARLWVLISVVANVVLQAYVGTWITAVVLSLIALHSLIVAKGDARPVPWRT
jgi:hypothetical protein